MDKLTKQDATTSSTPDEMEQSSEYKDGDEAIYKILVTISEKWWGKDSVVAPSDHISPQPVKIGKDPIPVNSQASEDLEKTIILSENVRPEFTEKTVIIEPEKPFTEPEDLEKTVVLSENCAMKPVSENSPAMTKKSAPEIDPPDSPEANWNDLEKTIILSTENSGQDPHDDQTIIIENKTEDNQTDDDDIILETVTLGPDSYEYP